MRVDCAPMKNLMDSIVGRKSGPEMVGPRVAALREAFGLTKSQFADSISLDRSSLTKIEAGKAGLDILTGERIALLYRVGLDFIYRGDLSDVPLEIRPSVIALLAKSGKSGTVN